MNLQGFYTNLGQALAAKIAAGTAPLTITRVVAGSGHTVDIPSAASLPDIRQTLTVGEAQVSGTTATLPVTLAEAQAEQSYQMTELGVYADDPDAGVVLFQVYQLSSAVAITAGEESVLRLYLRQTIGAEGVTVTCSSVGILLDADLESVRSSVSALHTRVNAVAIPSREVTMELSELQAYLNTLPRLLTEDLTIHVSGSFIGSIIIHGFYGDGVLMIDGGNSVVTGKIIVQNCAVPVKLTNFTVQATSDAGYGSNLIHAQDCCQYVWMESCTLIGNGKCNGFGAENAANVLCFFCPIQSCYVAAFAARGSYLMLSNPSVSVTYSSNSTGCSVYRGGIIVQGENVPLLLGGSANSKNGGLIVKADGTLG